MCFNPITATYLGSKYSFFPILFKFKINAVKLAFKTSVVIIIKLGNLQNNCLGADFEVKYAKLHVCLLACFCIVNSLKPIKFNYV